MHRLLIVDDERHIVDWLFSLFREETDLELDIYTAYNGREALSILARKKVDVILSDIRMPGLSGFELLEKVQSNWPGSRVIFLTGYNEFDYIYQASKSGHAYLLKTEDDEVIVSAVKRAFAEIEEEMRNHTLLENALNNELLVRYFSVRQLLLEAIRKTGIQTDFFVTRSEWQRYGLSLDWEQPVLLFLGCTREIAETDDYLEKSRDLVRLQLITEEYFTSNLNFQVIDWKNCGVLWLVQSKNGEEGLFYFRELLENFTCVCQEVIGRHFLFILDRSPVPWNKVETRVESLFSLMAEQLRLSGGSIIYSIAECDEGEIDKFGRIGFRIYELKQKLPILRNSLDQGDQKHFFSIFQELEKSFSKVQSMHYFPAIELYQSLALCIVGYINQNNLAEKAASQIGIIHLGDTVGFSSWGEAVNYLRRVAKILFELSADERLNNDANFINQLKAYVQSNLAEELTLVGISEAMHYNASYISRQFRQANGINLFDYINRLRIERAKELLLSSTSAVQTISKQVGFESPQYFSTIFKKNVGVTPLEYRKQQ